MKVLHSICQQIWKTQQWPQDWKRSDFIPIPKKGNAKEGSNYCTIAPISHASKVLLFLYHQFILPKPENDVPVKNGNPLNTFFQTFITFFQKKGIIAALAFILLFRFAESQLVKIASPFLLDNPEIGGLGLSTMQVGTIYGVVGLIALTIGGILGGILMAKNGLKHWIWWMTAAMNLPNLVYVYLAFTHPSNIWLISSAVAIEQFGYGFGFTALTYFMMLFSKGPQQTAHYAICTGFMLLSFNIERSPDTAISILPYQGPLVM